MGILIYFLLLILIPHTTSSITFNITNITQQNQNKEIVTMGDAYISREGIQVTPDDSGKLNNKAGRATYFKSLHLWDKNSKELASFATEFSFVIDSLKNNYSADGLTFFLAENNSVVADGGGMGLPVNTTTGNMTNPFVAVEFDTYFNKIWDPTGVPIYEKHVGIDVSSLFSLTHELWRSNISRGAENHVFINYDSFSKNLSVSVSNFEYGVIQLYYIIDLKLVLPEYVMFGFSAATGDLFEKNNVKSWNFSSSKLNVDENALPPTTGPKNINSPSPTMSNTIQVNKENSRGRMVGVIVGLFIIIGFLAIFAIFFWRRKKNKEKEEVEEMDELAFRVEMNKDFEMGIGPRRFSYKELIQATDGYVETNKLGQGGFGGVYKGFLKDVGMYIAVKRVSKTSDQGIKEYAAEVKIISRLRHKNLVGLKGWCHEKKELLLVYEFMENGSLDLHLFRGKSLLTWGSRHKIAHGLASALLYLHEEWEQCVLHRDIKSSNVMLDSNFNAKLGDFGLAKLVDHEKGSQTTMLAGTLGYLAPECVVTGKATKESDVFSFGVVALEIACGRKATTEYKAKEKEIRLLEWVWELYGTGNIIEAVDPRLELDYKEEEIKRLMIVGLWCGHPDSKLRPSMRQVIHVLNSEASPPILPSKMPVAYYATPPMSSLAGVTSIVQNQSSTSISYVDSSQSVTSSSYG